MKNNVARRVSLVLAAIATISGPSASAARTVYSSSGMFDGFFNGTVFTGKQMYFFGIGDDGDTVDAFGEQTTPLSSLRLVLDGTTYFIGAASSVFVDYENRFGGFIGNGDAGTFGILRFNFLRGTEASPWPVTFFSDDLTVPTTTTGGTLLLTGGNRLTFTYGATVSTVPEASTWLLLIAGFGVAGGSLRRRSGGVMRRRTKLRR